MFKRRSSRHVPGVRWGRVNRRALRLAAFSFLLPVPVALAAPLSSTLPAETLEAMSQVPVRGVGDTVLPRVLPLPAKASGKQLDPAASVTRVEKLARSRQQVRAQASAIAANGIPAAALRAYRTAEATMNIADPSCGLSWGLLAGIGRIESDHGRYGGAVLADNGISTPRILGLPLNGAGAVSAIADTDHGTLDGDKKWDRAVGPMQFIPSTWAMVGVDGDGDGQRNPHDIDDAALAAAAYLCVGDNDLTTPAGMHDAVLSYNHSEDYVATVLGVAHAYQSGIVNLPLLTATLTLPTGPGTEVGLTPGHGIAIGATDDVSKVGPKKARQARRGATDSTKGRTKDGTKAGDTKNDAKVGDRTQKPSGGGDQQKPPAGDGQGPVDDSTPRTGGGDKPTPTPEPKPTPEPNDPPSTGDNGGNGGGDETEPSPSPTPNPSPSPTPTPTPDPSQDVAEGTLVWCDEAAQDALCLDDAEHPLEVDVDSYKSLVDSPVTVIYGSTDGSLSGTICSIQPGKVDEPEC
jgi:membrane-bound lytic murein transglycosylase B